MNSGPIRIGRKACAGVGALPISVGTGRGVGPHVVVKAGAVAADVPIAVAAVAANSIGAETAAKVAIAAVITETPIAAITTDSVAAEIPAAETTIPTISAPEAAISSKTPAAKTTASEAAAVKSSTAEAASQCLIAGREQSDRECERNPEIMAIHFVSLLKNLEMICLDYLPSATRVSLIGAVSGTGCSPNRRLTLRQVKLLLSIRCKMFCAAVSLPSPVNPVAFITHR